MNTNTDLVSRSAVLETINEVDISDCTDIESIIDRIYAGVASVPTIDAVPVVHARWIDEIEPNAVTSSGREVHFYRCSSCGFQWNNKTAVFHYFKFCPNCGARMDAEEDTNGHQND